MNYRLYSFVANHYLSPLQCGLQTAHVVSEIASRNFRLTDAEAHRAQAFYDWANVDKTIIICGASNHAGVTACWEELKRINSALDLPAAIFHEDEQSMNGMATACGVIVPQKYWDVIYEDGIENGAGEASWTHSVKDAEGTVINLKRYYEDWPEGQFCRHLKSFRLA